MNSEEVMKQIEAAGDDNLRVADILERYRNPDGRGLPVLIEEGASSYPDHFKEDGFVLVKLRTTPDLRFGKLKMKLRKGDWTLMRLPWRVMNQLMKLGALGPVASYD